MGNKTLGYHAQVDAFRTDLLVRTLVACDGNVQEVCRRLDMVPRTCWRELSRLEIDPNEYRPE